jgi:hypothetical protein
MAAGRHRRRRGILQPTEHPRHTARKLHVARTPAAPSPVWDGTDWFAGLGWRDDAPWPTATAATSGYLGNDRRAIASPYPMTDVVTRVQPR